MPARRRPRRILSFATLAALAPVTLNAQDFLRTLAGQEPEQLSTPLRILALITVLSLVPSIVLMTTCFPRIVIVLSFLRRAIGTQELPPPQILVGLALFITAAIMAPTWERIYQDAIAPYTQRQIGDQEAYARAIGPMKEFMLARTLKRDLRLFLELSRWTPPPAAPGADPAAAGNTAAPGAASASVSELPLTVIIPAFLISELKVAFQMGFVLYLPFLIIDLIVAITLISMGMLVLPPFMISLPLKVLVFVLVDGWSLIVEQLVKSFQ